MSPADRGKIEISVVIVSDWVDLEHYDWRHEREIIKAVANQDFSGPTEVILVEDERCRDFVPLDDLKRLLLS